MPARLRSEVVFTNVPADTVETTTSPSVRHTPMRSAARPAPPPPLPPPPPAPRNRDNTLSPLILEASLQYPQSDEVGDAWPWADEGKKESIELSPSVSASQQSAPTALTPTTMDQHHHQQQHHHHNQHMNDVQFVVAQCLMNSCRLDGTPERNPTAAAVGIVQQAQGMPRSPQVSSSAPLNPSLQSYTEMLVAVCGRRNSDANMSTASRSNVASPPDDTNIF